MINNIQHCNNVSNRDYDKIQQFLKNQIKQPQNLAGLKRNANLKFQQLQLARAQGDLEIAAILTYEYQQIIQDIQKGGINL